MIFVLMKKINIELIKYKAPYKSYAPHFQKKRKRTDELLIEICERSNIYIIVYIALHIAYKMFIGSSEIIKITIFKNISFFLLVHIELIEHRTT